MKSKFYKLLLLPFIIVLLFTSCSTNKNDDRLINVPVSSIALNDEVSNKINKPDVIKKLETLMGRTIDEYNNIIKNLDDNNGIKINSYIGDRTAANNALSQMLDIVETDYLNNKNVNSTEKLNSAKIILDIIKPGYSLYALVADNKTDEEHVTIDSKRLNEIKANIERVLTIYFKTVQ